VFEASPFLPAIFPSSLPVICQPVQSACCVYRLSLTVCVFVCVCVCV
jgi:hypothetical protein